MAIEYSVVVWQDEKFHIDTLIWCTDKFGQSGTPKDHPRWIHGCARDYINVVFYNEEDAMLFKLTWL